MTAPDETAARWEGLGVGVRRFAYRLALERFEVEAALERWIVRPVLAASTWLDALEQRLLAGPSPAAPRPRDGDLPKAREARS